MSTVATATRKWPRRRLQIRSVLSSTMPFGWILVAATALIPYFLIGRGRGAGSLEMLGIARNTWMSVHVWSSIVVGLLTIAHVILNRRGLARSYRIISGAPSPAAKGNWSADGRKRGLAWVAALGVLVVVFAGGIAFAAVNGGGVATGPDRSRIEVAQDPVDTAYVPGATGSGRGAQTRGNRSGGGSG